jgi:hypothetical protein
MRAHYKSLLITITITDQNVYGHSVGDKLPSVGPYHTHTFSLGRIDLVSLLRQARP